MEKTNNIAKDMQDLGILSIEAYGEFTTSSCASDAIKAVKELNIDIKKLARQSKENVRRQSQKEKPY